MIINISKLDRILRVFVIIAVLILYFTGAISGTLGAIGAIFAAVLFGTVAFGHCPLYTLLGYDTCTGPHQS